MVLAWAQTARTALDGGRIWRGLVKQRPRGEADLGFGAADMIVVGLLLDLAEVDGLVCPADDLRHAIDAVFAEQGGTPPRRCLAAPNGSRHILLTPVAALGQGTPAAEGRVAQVVYGLSGLLPSFAGPVALRLLAGTAPALWQCGLALAVPPDGDAAVRALIADLASSMRGEWIDPLALYERVQVLTAKLKAAGQSEDRGEPEPEGNRLAELERELVSLKRAALVNQHLMLVDAAERVRNPT